ncbi:MAG: porin family protein [Bacteroidia bacterium]
MKTIYILAGGLLLSGVASAQVTDTVVKRDTIVKERIVETPPQKDPDPPFHSGEFGVRFMPSFSRFDIHDSKGNTVQADVVMSYGGGALLAINSKHVGLQLEAIYNQISQKYKDNSLERKVDISYINVPLLLTLNTDKSKAVNVNVAVGPQVGLNVGSRISNTGNNQTDTLHAVLAVKKGDLGLAYGAGIEFALNPPRTVRLDLGFRGVYGLIDISDKSATKATDSYLILDRTHIETYSGYIGLSFLF